MPRYIPQMYNKLALRYKHFEYYMYDICSFCHVHVQKINTHMQKATFLNGVSSGRLCLMFMYTYFVDFVALVY